jgi:ribonuclease HI
LQKNRTLNDLFEIAYHREKVASRRLAAQNGISQHEALVQTLMQNAAGSLEALIATRRQQMIAEKEQKDLTQQRKADARRNKALLKQPAAGAWLAWFDGATHPNPGKMGIGGILKNPDGSLIEISFNAGHGDSSEAEYRALIAVLQVAVKAQPPQLVIYGDSQVVINDVNPTSTCVASALTTWREQARRLLAQLPNVTLQWIPRHKNSAADALSQRAVTQIPIDD